MKRKRKKRSQREGKIEHMGTSQYAEMGACRDSREKRGKGN